MAVFTVFEHPTKGPDSTIFVKEGFSGSAFVFSVLWALWHRMWIVAAILLAILATLSLAAYQLEIQEPVVSLINLGMGLIFGFEAHDLRAASLRRAGYREAGLVMAGDLEEAEFKHAYLLRPDRKHAAVDRPRMQPSTDTLGLFGNV